MSYPFESLPDSGEIDLVDVELLKKYDVSGPRYTSYPTALEFNENYTEHDYLASITGEDDSVVSISALMSAPISIYIHIPFCESPCYYCGCNKIITQNHSVTRKYLDHLHKEMALMRLQLNVYKRPVVQMHWGGGTPTFLEDAEITELVNQLAKYFNLSSDKDRDYSIEIDPRTISKERIDLLKGLGFNRVSLGIQDFDENVQVAINRKQSFSLIEQQVEHIRASQFSSLNFDLIYGLPRQTIDSVEKTIEKVITLSPDRISYYNYAHLPHRFHAQTAIKDDDLPAADEKYSMMLMIISKLTAAGYIHLGMDHFVKPADTLAMALDEGKLCRNFQGYSVSKAADIVSLGVSSITTLNNVYVQNNRDLKRYYAALDENSLPIERGMNLSPEDILRRDIIQQLTCYRLLDIGKIEIKYGLCFTEHFSTCLAKLDGFEKDGLLIFKDGVIKITDKGVLFLRNICMVFDQYINAQGVNDRKIYSKVI